MNTKRTTVIALSTALVLAACSGPAPTPDEEVPTPVAEPEVSAEEELLTLLDEVWETLMWRYPGWATYEGDRRLGSLDLPMTRVDYSCSGCSEAEAKELHEHIVSHLLPAGGA